MVATVPAGTVLAEEQDFKATTVLWITSIEQEGNEALIQAEGEGYSGLLGVFTVMASLGQTRVPGCDPGTGEMIFSAEGWTLEIQADALVCFEGITGTWEVTGGTGEFSEASGGGTFSGSQSYTGHDPIVVHLKGSLSL
jgi:hypothetical protein